MEDIAMAAGASMSTMVTGFIPLPTIIEGSSELIVGFAGRYFLGKSNKLIANFFRGIWLVGLSKLITSFLPTTVTGTFPTAKATRETQVDGAMHSGWFGAEQNRPLYIARNPVYGTHTETKVAPSGTQHLASTVHPGLEV